MLKPVRTVFDLCLVPLFAAQASAVDERLSVLQHEFCDTVLSRDQMSSIGTARSAARDTLVDQYNKSDLGFKAVHEDSIDSITVFSVAGRVPEGAKARVLLLHGMGWNTSDHVLLREMIRTLSEPSAAGDSKEALYAQSIQAMLGNGRVLVGAEAIDLPGHGVGPIAANYLSVDASVDLIANHLKAMKAQTPGWPLVLFGWSWSGPLAVEVQRRYPDLLKGVVVLSSMELGENASTAIAGFEAGIPYLEGNPWARTPQNDSVTITRNREGISWISTVVEKIAPLVAADFKNMPTLFIYSENDEGVTVTTRAMAQQIAQENPLFKLWMIPGGDGFLGHEPFHSFGEDTKPFSVEAYKHLHAFLKSII